jgi:transcriptional regulator with PAS, ATPase and Fis domain
MIEIVKHNIKNLLKENQVSLAMIYDRDGEIIWHGGREVHGRNIAIARGFCKIVALDIQQRLRKGNRARGFIGPCPPGGEESLPLLPIRTVIVEPIDDFYILYLDSVIKDSYTKSEIKVFKTLFRLLKDMISRIRRHQLNVGGITGSSEAIAHVRELVLKYSVEEEVVLLEGETGVGKNHIASLIHRYSGRTGKFVVAHMPTIPKTLFESELFGHRKGAFTDARSDKNGLVAEAESGTLFLDEISEVPLSFQAKLLRFIDTKKYKVLGESFERTANVRIIAATNKGLRTAIEANEFREDLFYRLQVLEVEIPPLRVRVEDVRFLVMENLGFLKDKSIGQGFWDEMLNYHWPGNVRELVSVLKRAGILLQGPITGKDMRGIIRHRIGSGGPFRREFDGKLNTIWNQLQTGKSFWEVVKKPFMNRDLNRGEVKSIIALALKKGNGRYKNILEILNVEGADYKRFLNFVNDYGLNK